MAAQSGKYSTFSIARLLGVDPGSVANWIDRGLLKASRTPGGHRRVTREDLIDFLQRRHMPVPEQLDGRGLRVLIVDDEPAMTQIISRTIKAAHPQFQLAEAHNGFQAGSMLATMRPHVVILDLRMPGVDGYEVCRMARSQSPQTQVIAMIAHLTPQSRQQALDCGASACLDKPLSMERLLEEVESSLRPPVRRKTGTRLSP